MNSWAKALVILGVYYGVKVYGRYMYNQGFRDGVELDQDVELDQVYEESLNFQDSLFSLKNRFT